MTMKEFITAFLTAAALGAPLFTSAAASDKFVLKMGWTTTDGPQDAYAIGARAFKKEVEARSKGRIEVQLYPNRQLGDEKPMLEGLRFGTVDVAVITGAVVAQLEPSFQVMDLPFLFSNESQAHKVLDGPVGEKLAKKLETKGVVPLGYMEGGFRQMVNNVRPVTKPDDVKGVKYRVMQNPVYIDMFNSLGGSAVPMAWGEVFTAVQQGTVDGLEVVLASVDGGKFDEVTKYLSMTNHTYAMLALLVSSKTLAKLPADLRPIIKEAGHAAVEDQRRASVLVSKELVTTLEKKGMKVNTIQDIAPFRAAVRPMYEKFKSIIGSDVINEVLEAVK